MRRDSKSSTFPRILSSVQYATALFYLEVLSSSLINLWIAVVTSVTLKKA